jgi:hypothetical protein
LQRSLEEEKMESYSDDSYRNSYARQSPEDVLPPLLVKHSKSISCGLRMAIAMVIFVACMAAIFFGFSAGLAITQPPSGAVGIYHPLLWLHANAAGLAVVLVLIYMSLAVVARFQPAMKNLVRDRNTMIVVLLFCFMVGFGGTFPDGGYHQLHSLRQGNHLYRVSVWDGSLSHGQPRVVFWRCDWMGLSCRGQLVQIGEGIDPYQASLRIDGHGRVVVSTN